MHLLRLGVLLSAHALLVHLGQATPTTETWPESHLPALLSLLREDLNAAPGELQARLAQLEQAEAQVDQAERLRRPEVMFEAHGGLRNRYNIDDSDYEFLLGGEAELSASMPLYTWGQIGASQRIAHLQRELAEGKVEEVRRDLRERLRNTFLHLYVLTETASTGAEAVSRIEQNVANLQTRFDAGEVSSAELATARLDLAEARLDAREAAWEVAKERQRLRLLTARQDLPAAPRTDGFEAAANALNALNTDVFSGPALSADARELVMRRDMTDEELIVIQADTRPRLFLGAKLFAEEHDDRDDREYRVVGEIGLELRWRLFDWGRTGYRRLEKVAEQRHYEAQLDWQQAQDRFAFNGLSTERELTQERMELSRARYELNFTEATQLQQEQAAGRETLETSQAALARAEEARLIWRHDQWRLASLTLQLLNLAGYENAALGTP